MATSPTIAAFLDHYVALAKRLHALALVEDRDAALRSALEIFGLPPDESALPRPGQAGGASPKELGELAEAAGLVFCRDVAHGRLYRHPIVSTWIVSFSTSPGDVRSGQNSVQDLRQGYREARELIASVIEHLRQAGTSVEAKPRPMVLSEEAQGDIEKEIAKNGMEVVAAYNLFSSLPLMLAELAVTLAEKPTECGTRCLCGSCVSARALRKLTDSPCTEFGWTTLMAALRRVNRTYENKGPKAILQAAGITEKSVYEGIVQRLHYGTNGEWAKIMPESVATAVTTWFEAERDKARADKAAKYAPKDTSPQARAKELLTRTPVASDPAKTSAFLQAVNAYRKEQDSLVESLQAEVRVTRMLLTDVLAAGTDPQKLDELQEDLKDAKEQISDLQGQIGATREAAENDKATLRNSLGALLVALNTKVENVRAMRLAEDLNAISEAILNGAVELGIDLPVAQPA
ncbi:MAG TPA: hypothetical protein VLH09_06780 [Bryobacteraceae bacterium]|nr:hypothetical protein [Bryobacteraceae bacterium]